MAPDTPSYDPQAPQRPASAVPRHGVGQCPPEAIEGLRRAPGPLGARASQWTAICVHSAKDSTAQHTLGLTFDRWLGSTAHPASQGTSSGAPAPWLPDGRKTTMSRHTVSGNPAVPGRRWALSLHPWEVRMRHQSVYPLWSESIPRAGLMTGHWAACAAARKDRRIVDYLAVDRSRPLARPPVARAATSGPVHVP